MNNLLLFNSVRKPGGRVCGNSLAILLSGTIIKDNAMALILIQIYLKLYPLVLFPTHNNHVIIVNSVTFGNKNHVM